MFCLFSFYLRFSQVAFGCCELGVLNLVSFADVELFFSTHTLET